MRNHDLQVNLDLSSIYIYALHWKQSIFLRVRATIALTTANHNVQSLATTKSQAAGVILHKNRREHKVFVQYQLTPFVQGL